MKPLKISVGMTLDEDIVNKIRQLAEEDDRPLSQYVNLVLRRHLEQIERAKAKE